LAEIAKKQGPACWYFFTGGTPADRAALTPVLLDKIRKTYGGKVVTGHDLDIF
jgi:hypothetical protein